MTAPELPLLVCAHEGCQEAFRDYGYESPGFCGYCKEPYCDDHLYTGDASGDDGSGQYVTDLPEPLCEECLKARDEAGWEGVEA